MINETDKMVEVIINKFNVLFNDIAELEKEDYELIRSIINSMFIMHDKD